MPADSVHFCTSCGRGKGEKRCPLSQRAVSKRTSRLSDGARGTLHRPADVLASKSHSEHWLLSIQGVPRLLRRPFLEDNTFQGPLCFPRRRFGDLGQVLGPAV